MAAAAGRPVGCCVVWVAAVDSFLRLPPANPSSDRISAVSTFSLPMAEQE